EDVVEYHLHGGRAVIDGLLDVLAAQPGYRMAEPGEFTRRAFENGKMDLTEAEAVADLIHAETQAQKAQALAQMGGALYTLYEGWSDRLKTLLAHVEADIEFPDEDVPDQISPALLAQIKDLIAEIVAHLNDNRRGERLRDGIHIAVIGAPNAGKSSLVNALAQREVAIVSDLAGTTRDVIEAHLDLGGYPVILSDTAGLRPDLIGDDDAHGRIESEGMRRALARAQEADLRVLLFDGSQNAPDAETLKLADDMAVLAVNKIDVRHVDFHLDGALDVSVKNGAGLDGLLERLVARISNLVGQSDAPALTRKRHRQALESGLDHLQRSLNAALPELTAEDLRLAIRALGRITGRVDVEDLLDVIFKDFCIGK
ncbi:MAG: tRNA uridine-5-carboxymethylaminomethyl(34) synthesis GTPase MnmE, partial [Bdellovibrionales bacterium]